MSFEVSPDAYLRFMGRYSEPLAARFADLAGVHGGQRVLDVGCGPGALTAELVNRVGAAGRHGCRLRVGPCGRPRAARPVLDRRARA